MINRGTPEVYYQSINKAFLLFGVDKRLIILLFGICLSLSYAAHFAWYIDIFALIVFFSFYLIIKNFTKYDEKILDIFNRQIRYKRHYIPIAGIKAKRPLLKPSVPLYEGKA